MVIYRFSCSPVQREEKTISEEYKLELPEKTDWESIFMSIFIKFKLNNKEYLRATQLMSILWRNNNKIRGSLKSFWKTINSSNYFISSWWAQMSTQQ